jgi:hypothetical protein
VAVLQKCQYHSETLTHCGSLLVPGICCALLKNCFFPLQDVSVFATQHKGHLVDSRPEIQTKVLVWGLNDKDQLGGLKGSKVKLPVYSEALSALKPIHISGGSKSLFIVSLDGKVSCLRVI